MNPLKTLFNKVFDLRPASSGSAPKEDTDFEWNPEEETVAPTSAPATSWKRGSSDDGAARLQPEASHDIAASAHSLPTPVFDKKVEPGRSAPDSPPPSRPLPSAPSPSQPSPSQPLPSRPLNDAPPLPIAVAATPVPAAPPVWNNQTSPAPSAEPETHVSKASPTFASSAVAAVATSSPQPLVPLSDFEDVYRKAGIKSPPHGYGVERVYRLLTSRRLVGLDRSVRRSALLTALDAAGVPPSDVSQDAVLRRKALTAYEAEKALELQSLRSRNESRAEALQDTVETFTRQKQTQIERLAQGSTSAVRAQSDLEIRKRMEQDRLYRSLAYFVEPLPSPTMEAKGASLHAPKTPERLDTAASHSLDPEKSRTASDAVVTVTPPGASGDTRPLSQSGVEMALRAAAADRTAGRLDDQVEPDEPGEPRKPGSRS